MKIQFNKNPKNRKPEYINAAEWMFILYRNVVGISFSRICEVLFKKCTGK